MDIFKKYQEFYDDIFLMITNYGTKIQTISPIPTSPKNLEWAKNSYKPQMGQTVFLKMNRRRNEIIQLHI